MKYKIMSHVLFSVFALGFTAASAMEPFSSHLAVPVSNFIKEQIYDHRLTPHDVVDIETVSTEMNCQPIIAEINKSDCKIDITLRWISNRWGLSLPPEPRMTEFGLEANVEMTQYMAREIETRTYMLEQKDKEWADACRDFDALFEGRYDIIFGGFESFTETWQKNITEGLKRTTKKITTKEDVNSFLLDLTEWYGAPIFGIDVNPSLCFSGPGGDPESLIGISAFQIYDMSSFINLSK